MGVYSCVTYEYDSLLLCVRDNDFKHCITLLQTIPYETFRGTRSHISMNDRQHNSQNNTRQKDKGVHKTKLHIKLKIEHQTSPFKNRMWTKVFRKSKQL